MWVSRSMPEWARCTRSPGPVRIGVWTSCPAARRSGATRFQHQPPCIEPWTRTKVLIADASWVAVRLLPAPDAADDTTRLVDQDPHRGEPTMGNRNVAIDMVGVHETLAGQVQHAKVVLGCAPSPRLRARADVVHQRYRTREEAGS